VKINDIKSDPDNVAIKVIGRYFINCPAIPGQKSNGIKTTSVVRVDEITGQNT
jgi:hypothetical protein